MMPVKLPAWLLLLVAAGLLTGMILVVRPGAGTGAPVPLAAGFDQPPSVSAPSQADNGALLYWGMCVDCHADRGQGLDAAWRSRFPATMQDCWQAGCHGQDAPANSFVLPLDGVPPLGGSAALLRYSNAFEVYAHIRAAMPLSAAGSLSGKDAWALTAYLLRLNGREPVSFSLADRNGAAIPVHQAVSLPGPGWAVGLLAALLLFALAFWLGGRGLRLSRPSFFHHLHPPSIPEAQARLSYTLAAGGLSIFLCLVLLATGLLETFLYIPTPDQAAASVQRIGTLVPAGGLLRGLHYWSAQFLVLTLAVHLLRVVLTGAYLPPRRVNYVLGLLGFVLVLLLDFTGYVLRWDEGIGWALVVGTNLLRTIPWAGDWLYMLVVGADQPGPATLTRFYAWHLFGLTAAVVFLAGWHAFRLRRDGGMAVPADSLRASRRISRFLLLRREALAMLVAGAVLLVFAGLVPVPTARPITSSSLLSGESSAPWFFLWVQVLLKMGDPFTWGVLLPVAVLGFLVAVPYILPAARPEEQGTWLPRGSRLAQVTVVMIIAIILGLTLFGALGG